MSNSTITKNEVVVEIAPDELDTKGKNEKEIKRMRRQQPDQLIEMRLYVPGTASAARKRAKKEVKTEDGDVEMADGSDEQPEESGDDDQTAAQALHEELKDKADLNNTAGTPMVSFSDVHCLTPRYACPSVGTADRRQRAIRPRSLPDLLPPAQQVVRLQDPLHVVPALLHAAEARRGQYRLRRASGARHRSG